MFAADVEDPDVAQSGTRRTRVVIHYTSKQSGALIEK
jgi:hypothetical protein